MAWEIPMATRGEECVVFEWAVPDVGGHHGLVVARQDL